jgi:MerR family mercuric resistance operon transcriptional regulator
VTLTIGRLADAVGLGVETVRYYERRGLLREPPRSASGYRQYADDDVWRLRFILRGKDLGFTLGEIRDLLEEGDARPAAVLDAARRKRQAIADRQRELEALQARLEKLLRLCETGDDDCATLTISD